MPSREPDDEPQDPDEPAVYVDTTATVKDGKLTASIGFVPPEPDDDPPAAQIA